MRAVRFGVRMAQPGYNIFVTGPQGSGKHSSIKRALEHMAATMPPPPDWCYVHNFEASHRPRSLRFPAGQGAAFKAAMVEVVQTLKGAMPRLFEGEDYRRRRRAIEEEFRHTVDGRLDKLRQNAEAQDPALVERADGGFDFVPRRDGLVLSVEDYRRLAKRDREGLNAKSRDLHTDLERTMKDLGNLRERAVQRMRALDSDFGDLFKVQADFSTSAARDDQNCTAMLRLLASMARCDGLKQLAPSGAARMIDKAGTRKSNGCFQRGSFNARISDRLTYFVRPRLLRPIRLDGWWPF